MSKRQVESKHLALVVLLLSVVMAGAVACSPQRPPADAKQATWSSLVGKPAPDFTLPAAGGQEVSLSDYSGEKAVLLYFSMGPG